MAVQDMWWSLQHAPWKQVEPHSHAAPGGPEMKTLTYGNLKVQLDLSPNEEKIFIEALESDIAAARKFHLRRSR